MVSIDDLVCQWCIGCSLSLGNNGTKLCVITDMFVLTCSFWLVVLVNFSINLSTPEVLKKIIDVGMSGNGTSMQYLNQAFLISSHFFVPLLISSFCWTWVMLAYVSMLAFCHASLLICHLLWPTTSRSFAVFTQEIFERFHTIIILTTKAVVIRQYWILDLKNC